MGQEVECRMHVGRRALEGKAYLETDYILFRGDDRVKIAFKDLKSVTASAGMLKLEYDGGPASLAQALDAVLGGTGQSTSLRRPRWPLFARDQIRFGVCVSTTAIYPDVTCA